MWKQNHMIARWNMFYKEKAAQMAEPIVPQCFYMKNSPLCFEWCVNAASPCGGLSLGQA